MMRERADAYWKEYWRCRKAPDEKQLADAAQAKRLALQKRVDAGLKPSPPPTTTRIVTEAKAMQAAYNELSTANDALRKHLIGQARDGYETAQQTFEPVPHDQPAARSRPGLAAAALRGSRCAARSPGRSTRRSAISMRSPPATCAAP